MYKRFLLMLCIFISSKVTWAEGIHSYYSDLNLLQNFQNISSDDVVHCDGHSAGDELVAKTNSFATPILSVAGLNACNEIKNDISEFYSDENCKLLEECSKTRFSAEDLGNFYYNNLPKYSSEDFVIIKLDGEIKEMEKIEGVRQFAEKKYGDKFASSCKQIFDYDSKEGATTGCDVKLMDNGFNKLQKSCSAMSNSCYNSTNDPLVNEYNVYEGSAKGEDKNASVMQSFFKGRIDNNISNSLTNDTEMLGMIGALITSNHKSEDKVREIFVKLSEYKKQGKLDPIFDFNDFSSDPASYKESVHYKFLKDLASKKLNFAEAKSKFEDYRKSIAKKILGDTCPKTSSFKSICSEATLIAHAKKFPHYNKRMALMYRMENMPDDERFSATFGKFPTINSKENFKILMNAQRCRYFSLDQPDPLEQMLPDHYSSDGFKRAITPYYLKTHNITAPSTDAVIKLKEDEGLSAVESKVAPTTSQFQTTHGETNQINNEKINKNESLASSVGVKNLGNGANLPAVNPQSNDYIDPSGVANFDKTGSRNKNSDDRYSVKDDQKGSASQNAVNDKISELQKRLKASEDNLDRIRSEKEEADLQSARQKKIDEENKTIADLNAQVSALKADAKKPTEVPIVKESPVIDSGASTVSSSRSAQIGSEGESSQAAQPASAHDQGSANNMNHAGGAFADNAIQNSTVRATAAGVAGGTSAVSSDSKSSLVLTKMDGLSSENASAKINDKILELNGQPFYIEEGGFVKEIVPVVKDGKVLLDEKGKPIYTKVIKGKATDKKFANGKALNKDERAPASIDNAADLKRAEEERLKHERAEYLKLKKLTKDVFEKK